MVIYKVVIHLSVQNYRLKRPKPFEKKQRQLSRRRLAQRGLLWRRHVRLLRLIRHIPVVESAFAEAYVKEELKHDKTIRK
jgi:hypothetical protein